VLLEPASVLAKAWEQIDSVSRRAFFTPRRALVTGAGPIGLLAFLMGTQRGYEMFVVDLEPRGRKRELVEALGGHYHVGSAVELDVEVDVIVECTGLGDVVWSAVTRLVGGGIMCLAGIMNLLPKLDADGTAFSRTLVLRNQLVFGTVNAGRRHWELALSALTAADPRWLSETITRRVPLSSWPEALNRRAGDVKTVVDLTA
jgi:threonine dehydrogenase-like Zn-dependent dehydrogenase